MSINRSDGRVAVGFVRTVAALALLGAGAVGTITAQQLTGTPFPSPQPATAFTLTDQSGAPYSLAQSAGKVVILTFLYTHCTDVCPFIAAKLRQASDLLADLRASVDIVVITTDPDRDTPGLLATYSTEFGMSDRWHFLTGSLDSVAPLWKAYYVDVQIEKGTMSTVDPGAISDLEAKGLSNGMSGVEVNHALAVIGKFGGGYEVDHSTPIIFIDPAGRMRVVLDENASAGDIANDARTLAARS